MPVYKSLTNSTEYHEVLSTGTRARRNGVIVCCAPGRLPGRTRIGLAAKAGRAGAVPRNRARRRLREAIAASLPSGGFDIVVRAGPEAEAMEFQELVRTVREAMTEAGVACG